MAYGGCKISTTGDLQGHLCNYKPFLTGESALGQGHQPDDCSQSPEALLLMTCIDLQTTHSKI